MKLSWIQRLPLIVAVFVVTFARVGRADDPVAKPANAEKEAIIKGVRYWNHPRVTLRLTSGMDSLIGVEVTPAEEVLRVQLGLGDSQGLAVTNVAKEGPADQAGIHVNDVLITIEDKDITNVETLHKQLQEFVDKPVKVGYIRAAARHVVDVTPKKSASTVRNLQPNQLVVNESARFWLGIGLANVDATLRSQLNIPDSEGLVVTSVEADSPSSKAGVMVNDVLLKLDGKPLKTIEELSVSLQEIGEKAVALELLRRGKSATLSVMPQKHPQRPHAYHVVSPAAQTLTFTIPETGSWGGNTEEGMARVKAAMELARVSRVATINAIPLPIDPNKGDLAIQINKVLEQTRQLQGSLEALAAEIKDSKASTNKGDPKPTKP